MSFLETIKARARSSKKTIVLPETTDLRTLKAAHTVLQEELANVILIGNREEINSKSKDLDLAAAEIVDPQTFEEMEDYINALVELRKNKGMTYDKAWQASEDNCGGRRTLYAGLA